MLPSYLKKHLMRSKIWIQAMFLRPLAHLASLFRCTGHIHFFLYTSSPAAVGWFRASSSMIVAVRYFVSYLYLKDVSSGTKTMWDKNYITDHSCNHSIINKALVSHHLLLVLHHASVSVGPSSAVPVSQSHVQTQLLHQHLTVAVQKGERQRTLKNGGETDHK